MDEESRFPKATDFTLTGKCDKTTILDDFFCINFNGFKALSAKYLGKYGYVSKLFVDLILYQLKNFSRNFAEKFHKNLCGPHYEQPKETDVYPSFAVVHYAGRVSTEPHLFCSFFFAISVKSIFCHQRLVINVNFSFQVWNCSAVETNVMRKRLDNADNNNNTDNRNYDNSVKKFILTLTDS